MTIVGRGSLGVGFGLAFPSIVANFSTFPAVESSLLLLVVVAIVLARWSIISVIPSRLVVPLVVTSVLLVSEVLGWRSKTLIESLSVIDLGLKGLELLGEFLEVIFKFGFGVLSSKLLLIPSGSGRSFSSFLLDGPSGLSFLLILLREHGIIIVGWEVGTIPDSVGQ
jgi:anti-sigma factor RsiW